MTFQRKLAISPVSLHIVSAILIAVWLFIPDVSVSDVAEPQGLWPLLPDSVLRHGFTNTAMGCAMAAAVVYMLGELNMSQILLRLNSRAISIVYAALMAMALPLHSLHPGLAAMLCVLMSYFTLFGSYQVDSSAGMSYISFLSLGFAVLVSPKLIWMTPFYWLSLYLLRSANVRSMIASVLGLITPLWLVGSIAFCAGRFDIFCSLMSESVSFDWGGYSLHTHAETLTVWFSFVVFIIGFADFYLRINLDKTRTRTIYTVTAIHGFVLYLLILLQPLHLHYLLPAAMVPTAIMGGHYVANDQTTLSNTICIILAILLIISIAASAWIL